MKKLLFLLVFIPLISFGQTAVEYFDSGYDKSENGDYNGAISDYNKAIEINPNFAEAYYNRAITKYYMGNYIGACEDAKKAGILGIDFSKMIESACN